MSGFPTCARIRKGVTDCLASEVPNLGDDESNYAPAAGKTHAWRRTSVPSLPDRVGTE